MIDDQSEAGSWAKALRKPVESAAIKSARGKKSRNKGATYERELVNEFKEYGLKCQRVPLSGATDYAKGDIEVTPGFDPDAIYRGEAKRRARLPKLLTENLKENDFVALREDRGETVIVISLKTFVELMQ